MEQWEHGGGFSLDASVRIEAHDRRGLERLLRDCARPPFAAGLAELDTQRLIDHRPKPGSDGRTPLILSPLELIGRIAARVPPPTQHRHRYYDVLASHSPLRPAVTALAPGVGSVGSVGSDRARARLQALPSTTRRRASDAPPPPTSGPCSWPASTRHFP